jgi:hypothetical protein
MGRWSRQFPFLRFRWICAVDHHRLQCGLEGLLEDLCIFGDQCVLLAKYFVRPGGCVIARTKLADLSDQPIPQLRRRFGSEHRLGSRAYFCIAPAMQRRLMLRAIQLTITQALRRFGAWRRVRWRRQIRRVNVVLAGNAD